MSYRPDLPLMPSRILKLPIERGYPVPWFVAFVDGHYDFRVIGPGKLAMAHNKKLCWICGEPRGRFMTFPIGPMCAVNRISSEPPSHLECAEFSAKACPFLIDKEQARRTEGLPAEVKNPAGCMIPRQPGVILLWTTREYHVVPDGRGGHLFHVGEPTDLRWYREGRPATRGEVLHSIHTGLPILKEAAEHDGPKAIEELNSGLRRALEMIPAD